MVLELTKAILSQPHAALWVSTFTDVITVAHTAVALASDAQPPPVAPRAASAAPKTLSSAPPTTSTPQARTRAAEQFAQCAADLVAIVITLLRDKRRQSVASTASIRMAAAAARQSIESNPQAVPRALPVRNLKHAVDALAHVVKATPMLPGER